MNINPVNLLAALIVSALLSFGIYSIDNAEPLKMLFTFGSLLFFASTLCLAIGCTFTSTRAGVNIKIVAMIFFILALLFNLLWAIFGFSQTSYIIVGGILFLIYIVVANGVYKAQI